MSPPMIPYFTPFAYRPGPALYHYAAAFLYSNRVSAEKILFGPRMMNILMGCFLGVLIFLWSSRLYGTRGGILSLALFSFCPNLIAHSSLATTDLCGITFAVLFLCTLDRLIEKKSGSDSPSILMESLCGTVLGLALLAKFTNVFLIPLFILAYPVSLMGSWKIWRTDRRILKSMGIVLVTAWTVLCSSYGFQNVFILHTLEPSDWALLGLEGPVRHLYSVIPLPDTFLRGLSFIIAHGKNGQSAFFFGSFSNTGWALYFPAAFLLKTPTATLLILVAWIILLVRKKISLSKKELILFLSIACVLGAAMTAGLNIGLRHVLLCYPLFYILAGSLEKEIRLESKKMRIAAAMGFLLLGGEVWWRAPDYLAFFNEISGGPAKGILYLSDSNIDWGQDLNHLGKFLQQEGNPEVVLSYFGTAVPQYYGIDYQELPTYWSFPGSKHINSTGPKKEFLAISVTNLQGTYFIRHDLYSWLLNKEPIRKIGSSIYVYDITDDMESQKKLLEIYQMTGETDKIKRQAERIRLLDKRS
jgi:hypothetical protein